MAATKKYFVAAIFLLASLFVIGSYQVSYGQETVRSYSYASFDAVYTVNTDASMHVAESITYRFNGTYNKGYRTVPSANNQSIKNVHVIDGDTGIPLAYSPISLDKTNPNSWGKYTSYASDQGTAIEWYYNESNSTKTWRIEYDVPRAVSFEPERFDELYWNIFSGLEAPVATATAKIVLPAGTTAYQSKWYLTGTSTGTVSQIDSKMFLFETTGVSTGKSATIALGWDKGIVSEKTAQKKAFVALLVSTIVPIAILLGAALFSWRYWRWKEGIAGRIVVTEFTPPKDIPPAYAALAVYGKTRPKDLAATLIDLAIRGVVTIEAKPAKKVSFILGQIAVVTATFLITYVVMHAFPNQPILLPLLIASPVYIAALVALGYLQNRKRNNKYAYTVTKKNSFSGYAALLSFEKDLIQALFPADKKTWDSSRIPHGNAGEKMASRVSQAIENIRSGFGTDNKGYEIKAQSFALKKRAVTSLIGFLMFGLLITTSGPGSLAWIWDIPTIEIYLALILAGVLVAYVIYFGTPLSKKGESIRDELLGFKRYLQVAERYRLQNLSPAEFEKFLPYAMVFGVEKEWAKSFKNISVPTPSWYSGVNSGYGSSASFSSFSPSFFTANFGTSMANSIVSTSSSASSGGFSGGGGFSSGGGFSGGGGGGGGGGAS